MNNNCSLIIGQDHHVARMIQVRRGVTSKTMDLVLKAVQACMGHSTRFAHAFTAMDNQIAKLIPFLAELI